MEKKIIEFAPPLLGMELVFNTFRIGGKLAKELKPGDTVILADSKNKIAFGQARVESIDFGELWEMCMQHASRNHLEQGFDDKTNSPARIYGVLQKFYGPQIVNPNKKSTVVYLRRIPDDC